LSAGLVQQCAPKAKRTLPGRVTSEKREAPISRPPLALTPKTSRRRSRQGCAFRVRRDGGISHREREPRTGRDQIVRTELTAALLCLAGLVALSILVDAPLGPPADPTALITEPHAPWFFRWVQEQLRVAPPLLAGVLTPLAVLLLLSILPYTLDRSDAGVAEWFNRPGRVGQVVFLIITVGILLLTLRATIR